jgi:hypothetical protein
MPEKTKPRFSSQRITLGLPDIQEQLRVIDHLTRKASDNDRRHLEDLGTLLSEFYSQLQHQKQITIYRFTSRTKSKSDMS